METSREINKDENGVIVCVNGWVRSEKGDWIHGGDLQGNLPKPVTLLMGGEVTKQYCEEWNTGTTEVN